MSKPTTGDDMKDAEQYPFFVILHHPSGGILPMIDEYDELALYETFDEAADAAENNILGQNIGYEIFEAGWGGGR